MSFPVRPPAHILRMWPANEKRGKKREKEGEKERNSKN
jgi:hypothetical protein